MEDISELPDKWLAASGANTNRSAAFVFAYCADQLETALPVWTNITDDPDTWPDDGQSHYISRWLSDGEMWSQPAYQTFCQVFVEHNLHQFIGQTWRPRCSLDHPPKDQS